MELVVPIALTVVHSALDLFLKIYPRHGQIGVADLGLGIFGADNVILGVWSARRPLWGLAGSPRPFGLRRHEG